MTIDKSLKIKAGGVKSRNVLSRSERLAKLAATDRWQEGDPVLGIPKVRVEKITLKKKKAKKDEAEESDRDRTVLRTSIDSRGVVSSAVSSAQGRLN